MKGLMKKEQLIKKIYIFIMVVLLVAMPLLSANVLAAGNGADETDTQSGDTTETVELVSSEPEYKSFDELNGKTVSMLTGAPFEDLVSSKVPDVKEYTYYTSMADMLLGLKSGKTDAILNNNAVSQLAVNRDSEIAFFPETLRDCAFGIAFTKGNDMAEVWQEAYDKIPRETVDQLWEKWTGSDDSAKILMEQDWPGNGGTVEVAACDALEPMSYAGEGGQLCGFDVEVILLMAKELDIHVNFTGMDFSAALAAVQAGKCDMACGSIVISDERKEKMDFVEYYPAAIVLVVRSAEAAEPDTSLWGSIKSSFYKTFIRESRYKLFIKGTLTTLLITLCSIIFGTILGFFVYMACRRGNVFANKLTGTFVWIVQGLPVVVLLMVLYYIIFGSTHISGIFVSIVAFTLVFGAATFGMLKAGVNAVDKGQTEAAYALGYSDIKCFFRIILPQAIPHFLPAFKGEVVSLAKATAIVGYIAVQDLTKMGDIIRGRTYDAFFFLFAVALIYFMIGSLLRFLIGWIESAVDPKKRKKDNILKGVRTDD